MSSKTLLTKDGFQKLTEQLQELKLKQNHLVSQIEEVAQPDESGEDVLATQLKEELELVNSNIDEIENALENSQIITDNKSKGVVQIGSTVKIKISGKTETVFNIVNHFESNPAENKISNESPLGLALIGKKINDEVEVDAPVGKITYKIVSIK